MVTKDRFFYIGLIASLLSIGAIFTIGILTKLNYFEITVFLQYLFLLCLFIMIGSLSVPWWGDRVDEDIE